MSNQSPQESLPMQKVGGITSSTLKLIAIITMLIDHIGASVLEKGVLLKIPVGYGNTLQEMQQYFAAHPTIAFLSAADGILRLIGRIAFPIFCFLLVQGFLHTHDVKKYALRLFAFALISEVPFDLAFTRQIFYSGYQNVFFTLLFGLLVMIALQWLEQKGRKQAAPQVAVQNAVEPNAAEQMEAEKPHVALKWRALQLLAILAGMGAAYLLKTDYSWFGVFFITGLYIFHKSEWKRNLFGCFAICWEITAPLAFIPIHFYNGQRGLKLKYVFYLFYPVHLLILGLITIFCFPMV